jgi:hypothetical protein
MTSTYTLPLITITGYINGVAFNQSIKPTSIKRAENNVGEKLQAVDGSVIYMHRSFKRAWDLTWDRIVFSGSLSYPLNTVAGLRYIYTGVQYVNSEFWLTVDNQTFQIIPDPGSWSEDLSANSVSLTNKPYYNVTFRVVEI